MKTEVEKLPVATTPRFVTFAHPVSTVPPSEGPQNILTVVVVPPSDIRLPFKMAEEDVTFDAPPLLLIMGSEVPVYSYAPISTAPCAIRGLPRYCCGRRRSHHRRWEPV